MMYFFISFWHFYSSILCQQGDFFFVATMKPRYKSVKYCFPAAAPAEHTRGYRMTGNLVLVWTRMDKHMQVVSG